MAQAQVPRSLLLHSSSRLRCSWDRALLRSSWNSARYLTQGPAAQSQSAEDEKPIVVLGGGIAGLTTALSLARELPPTRKIVLLEKQSALGGWVNSDRVQMPNRQHGTALIEAGPRSLRPKGVAGWRMLELVSLITDGDFLRSQTTELIFNSLCRQSLLDCKTA